MVDAIIIGSGFGGSAIAYKLNKAGYRIVILERGPRFDTGNPLSQPGWNPAQRDATGWVGSSHPYSNRALWDERENPEKGWFHFQRFQNASVLSGVGVGGGSLVYGNVFSVPPASTFDHGWPKEISFRELKPYFSSAGKTMEIEQIPEELEWNKTKLLFKATREIGIQSRFRKLDLGIRFANAKFIYESIPEWSSAISEEDRAASVPNPRTWGKDQCIHRGDCSIGCPVNAKHTVDRTYLGGISDIRPLHAVRDIRQDRDGYVVTFENLRNRTFGTERSRVVIVAAGSLGSTELLLRCKQNGGLPRLSPTLGRKWSTNGFLFFPCFSKATRVYPNLGPHSTCAVDFSDGSQGGQRFSIEDGGFPSLLGSRLFEWLGQSGDDDEWAALARGAAKEALRKSERDFSNSLGADLISNLLPLIVQGVDASNGRVVLKNGRVSVDWDLSGSNQLFYAVEPLIRQICSAISADFLVPFAGSPPKHIITPHPLGGCPMGDSPETGVVDHTGKVHNYEGLYVSGAPTFPSAIGFPPARVIASLAERTADFITGKKSDTSLLKRIRRVGLWLSRRTEPPGYAGYTTERSPANVGDVSELEKDEPTQPRYPCASFYAGRTTSVRIEETDSISSNLEGIELHFWIDVERGVSSLVPTIVPPGEVVYPLTFEISVWSEEIDFAIARQSLVLDLRGSSPHAIFPVRRLPRDGNHSVVFIFMSYEGTLVGAFRKESLVNTKLKDGEYAQKTEVVYVSKDWFRFDKAPPRSALTLFIDKRPAGLALFSLKPGEEPWGALAPSENDLYTNNKDIYRELQTLARQAGEALENGSGFSFAVKGKRLANLGYTLFGQIFLQAISSNVATFPDTWISGLPEGSVLTIALGRNCQNLCVPWGLLYDHDPPHNFFDLPDLNGFWGYKFNLVIRPHGYGQHISTPAGLPIKMGGAWLDHPETVKLKEDLRPFQSTQRLSVEEIRVHDNSLPVLASTPFDLLEFFCHGHSKVPGLFDARDTAEILDEYLKSQPQGVQSLMAAIDSSADSLIELNGGFITLTKLADVLKRGLPSSPVVFLSMCESAQFTSSGTGFVPLFLRRGARAVIGTEGPTLWSLSRQMDKAIIGKLLEGQTISDAFYETRKELARSHMLALIYTLYGDGDARLV